MLLAFLLLSTAKILFLLQYYCLVVFLITKNFISKILNFTTEGPKLFSHPKESVHPHVFVHTCNFFSQSDEFIKHQQFTLDVYECQTQDNAYVTFWRIRHADPAKWNDENPVLIQHGLLDCSMSWFLHEEKQNFFYFREKTLPYVLANEGYDVWVGNNRGTVYSDKNSHLPGYWNFNIDHFIKYDQPVLINKVLQETGKNKLIYIGHSQGSTQFLLAQAEHPDLNNKIQKFIGMGTVISLSNLKEHKLLQGLSRFYLVEILQKLGFKAILTTPKWMKHKLGVLIHHFEFYVNFVISFISFLCGKTQKNNLDGKRLGILAAHEPGGTSIYSIKHWIQAYRHGKFRRYDYGAEKNIEIYGSQVPKEYTFDHIKELPFKAYIFRGSKDAVISDEDFELLVGYFDQSNVEVHTIDDYAHLDYAWGVNAKEDIYDKIVEILKSQKVVSSVEKSESYQTQDTSYIFADPFIDANNEIKENFI